MSFDRPTPRALRPTLGRRRPSPGRLRPTLGWLLASLGWLVGCATTATDGLSPSGAAALDVARPAWLERGCRAHWADPAERRNVVCAIGSAPAHRNRVVARETAVARARSEIARSLEVTIESLVRLEEPGSGDARLETIVHQLSSASLRGVRVEAVWRAPGGAVHALVSLDVDRVRESVRSHRALTPARREALAERAVAALTSSGEAPGAASPDAGDDR